MVVKIDWCPSIRNGRNEILHASRYGYMRVLSDNSGLLEYMEELTPRYGKGELGPREVIDHIKESVLNYLDKVSEGETQESKELYHYMRKLVPYYKEHNLSRALTVEAAMMELKEEGLDIYNSTYVDSSGWMIKF